LPIAAGTRGVACEVATAGGEAERQDEQQNGGPEGGENRQNKHGKEIVQIVD
jgi:hypothetical protein